jgi:hypothetical protein
MKRYLFALVVMLMVRPALAFDDLATCIAHYQNGQCATDCGDSEDPDCMSNCVQQAQAQCQQEMNAAHNSDGDNSISDNELEEQ